MLKVRVIPILTFNGFGLVKTKKFSNPRMVGNPVQAARVYNARGVDELIFLDIKASDQSRKINLTLVRDIINECFMPVGIGGGIDSLDDINDLLKIGADKIVVKSKAIKNPGFVTEASLFFGRQCISVAVDAFWTESGYKVYNNIGADLNVIDFTKQMRDKGAGEIVITSVDNDGMMKGFDTHLVSMIEEVVSLPLIAVGGGGELSHYRELFAKTKVEAVGSASIFHFTQHTSLDIKTEISKLGRPVRRVETY